MIDETTEVFSYAELNYLRMEAMDLFERCLTEGNALPLEAFVERQISQTPPRVELLREIAEQLHQRLISLRENHFDLRDRTLRALRDTLRVDLSALVPLNALGDYHLLKSDDIIVELRQQYPRLTEAESHIVRKALDTSMDIAAQLYRDVELTTHLYNYVMDWVMALSAILIRRAWTLTLSNPQDDIVH